MKEVFEKFKKDKWFLLFFCIFCFAVFLVVVPHYDEDGKQVLIGKFYTTRSSKINKKENELKNWENKNVTYLTSRIVTLQKNKQDLEEKNKVLTEQIDVLTNKLTQQENFYKNKKEETEQIKKVSFSNVSKKQVNTQRPEFGNSFSKAIKKSKIDL